MIFKLNIRPEIERLRDYFRDYAADGKEVLREFAQRRGRQRQRIIRQTLQRDALLLRKETQRLIKELDSLDDPPE